MRLPQEVPLVMLSRCDVSDAVRCDVGDVSDV